MNNLIAQRWAVRNVARCTFYDIATNEMLTFLEHLKSSGIETSSETVYARGGDGNPKLVGFSSNKESKVNLSSALFDNRAMALLTGNKIKVGVHEIYQRDVIPVVGGIATLKSTPKDDKLLSLYIMGADGVEGQELKLVVDTPTETDYSLAGKKITVDTSIVDGTNLVAYFMVDTPENSQTITVSSDSFPAAFKLVMEVLVKDFHTKKLYPAQIIIPSAQMEDSWSFSFEPDGEPAPLDMPIEILKPANSNDMWTMTIYDDKALA